MGSYPPEQVQEKACETVHLHSQAPQGVDHTKYRCVMLTSDITWEALNNDVINKASRTLGLLRWILKIGDKSVKEQAYESFVRMLLKYVCSCPCGTLTMSSMYIYIRSVEAIQQRAARLTLRRHCRTFKCVWYADSTGLTIPAIQVQTHQTLQLLQGPPQIDHRHHKQRVYTNPASHCQKNLQDSINSPTLYPVVEQTIEEVLIVSKQGSCHPQIFPLPTIYSLLQTRLINQSRVIEGQSCANQARVVPLVQLWELD